MIQGYKGDSHYEYIMDDMPDAWFDLVEVYYQIHDSK